MQTPYKPKTSAVLLTALFAAFAALFMFPVQSLAAVDTNLLTKLAAYWPLNSSVLYTNGSGKVKTKDIVNRYDLTLFGFTAANLGQGYTNYNPTASSNSYYGTSDTTFFWTNNNGTFGPAGCLFYDASAGDPVPPENNSEYTVSMWVCVAGGALTTNMFGDPATFNDCVPYAQANSTTTDPFWILRVETGDTSGHWAIRSQNEKGFPAYGFNQLPNYNQGTESAGTYGPQNPGGCCNSPHLMTTPVGGTGFQSGALFDGTWHHLAWTMDTNGSYSTYVDGIFNSGNWELSTNRSGLAVVLPDRQMTNQNGSKYLYTHNRFALYALDRTSVIFGINGRLDDVAVWKRALSSNEINEVMTNGIPANLIVPVIVPVLNGFDAQFPECIPGDTIPLIWKISNPASADAISINNGIGDVRSLTDTNTGFGTLSVPVSGVTTYTLTMVYSNGHPGNVTGGFTNALATTVSNAPANTYAAGWHLLSRFDNFKTTTLGITGPSSGKIANIGWVSQASDPGGAGDLFNVRNLVNATNYVATEGGLNINARPAVSALFLNSYTQAAGTTNTLFFRFLVSTTNCDSINFGFFLTPNGFFQLGDYLATPSSIGIGFVLNNGGSGANPVDLQAYSGPAGNLGSYSYVADGVNGDPKGLKKGVVYNAWVDVLNAGSSNAFYNIYIATNGGSRVALVTSNLSGINNAAAPANTNYDRFVMTHDATYSSGGNNTVLLDDIYISTNGVNATVPVPASALSPVTPIVIAILGGTNLIYDPANGITLNWTDNGCGPYSVQKSPTLSPATWATLTTGLTTRTFQDSFVPGPGTNGFYRITSP